MRFLLNPDAKPQPYGLSLTANATRDSNRAVLPSPRNLLESFSPSSSNYETFAFRSPPARRPMRHQSAKLAQSFSRPCLSVHQPACCILSPNRRSLQIHATPSSANPSSDTFDTQSTSNLTPPTTGSSPDARFEVLGGPSSLLSVSLSASQNLFTRRGTLVGVSGPPENAVSTLSPLSPVRRALLGITFMYQKVTSATPLNLLIATKAPHTSFSVVHLDGRVDWTVAQRQGLVAWTGHTLSVKPSANLRMSLAHWGNTVLTGRGLVALAGSGQIYQITLNVGETYIAHPSNILAYTLNTTPPSPYRFKSSTLRLQLPTLSFLSSSKFMRTMATTATWKTIANAIFAVRTWARRTFWGDRLFLSFTGPTTLLLQSRGSRLRDSLSYADVNEIAEAPAGLLYQQPTSASLQRDSEGRPLVVPEAQKVKVSFASVDKGGRVAFEEKK